MDGHHSFDAVTICTMLSVMTINQILNIAMPPATVGSSRALILEQFRLRHELPLLLKRMGDHEEETIESIMLCVKNAT